MWLREKLQEMKTECGRKQVQQEDKKKPSSANDNTAKKKKKKMSAFSFHSLNLKLSSCIQKTLSSMNTTTLLLDLFIYLFVFFDQSHNIPLNPH